MEVGLLTHGVAPPRSQSQDGGGPGGGSSCCLYVLAHFPASPQTQLPVHLGWAQNLGQSKPKAMSSWQNERGACD